MRTFREFDADVTRQFAFYGFASNPLAGWQRRELFESGATIDRAYNIGCDIAAGFTYTEAVQAND